MKFRLSYYAGKEVGTDLEELMLAGQRQAAV
jgi:hypothetical protein